MLILTVWMTVKSRVNSDNVDDSKVSC